MLDYEKAKLVAVNKLREIESRTSVKLSLLKDESIVFEFGWIFFYQSEKYVQTGELKYMLGGNSPIMVDKFTEEVIPTGTGKPISYYIEEYCKRRKG